MFKFERFGGFNNKRKHLVQFKKRDKALSPSIIGIPSPKKFEPVVSTSSSSSSNSSLNITDPFEFQPLTPTKKSVELPKEQEEEEEEEEDDIFNFPETQEYKEIKLMVASNRPIPSQEKKNVKRPKKKSDLVPKKSYSNETNTIKKATKVNSLKKKVPEPQRTLQPPPSQVVVENNRIMQLNMNNIIQHNMNNKKIIQQQPIVQPPLNKNRFIQPAVSNTNRFIQPTVSNVNSSSGIIQPNSFINFQQPQQQQQLQKEEEDSIFDIFDFDFNPTVHIRHNSADTQQQHTTFNNYTHKSPMTSIHSILNDNVMDQVNHFLQDTPPKPLANITNVEQKKRKRNLVAQLKSASGDQKVVTTHQEFDFLSDEEELLASENSDVIPFREFIQKERSMSPELTYKERMELELDSMMKTEFGSNSRKEEEDLPVQQQQQRRPRYQPQNKLNVKYTFEKKKK